jgi:hypothetical protein
VVERRPEGAYLFSAELNSGRTGIVAEQGQAKSDRPETECQPAKITPRGRVPKGRRAPPGRIVDGACFPGLHPGPAVWTFRRQFSGLGMPPSLAAKLRFRIA